MIAARAGLLTGEREDFRKADGEADAAGDFLDEGFREFFCHRLAEDSRDAAAPLFDKFQLAKHPGDDGITELGDAAFDVIDGQAGEEQAGAFDLDAVIVEGHANGGATARIVGVDEGVDDDFAEDVDGDAPEVFAADFGKVGPAHGVLFEKEHDFIHGLGKRIEDVDVVEDVGLVVADEASALDPRVVEVLAAVEAVEQDATLARDEATLVFDENPQALKHGFIDGAPAFKVLGDGFEIENVDGEIGHGQGIKTDPRDTALEFSNQLGVGLAIGGAETDIGAACQPFGFHKMRTHSAEKHFHHQKGFAFHGDHFNPRHQTRRDRVRDQAG